MAKKHGGRDTPQAKKYDACRYQCAVQGKGIAHPAEEGPDDGKDQACQKDADRKNRCPPVGGDPAVNV